MKEIRFQNREEATIAHEKLKKVFKEEPSVYLNDAISRHPMAKHLLYYLKLCPCKEEVAAIQHDSLEKAIPAGGKEKLRCSKSN